MRWRGALGIALSVILLAWTLRGVAIAAVWRELGAADGWLLLASAAVATLSYPIRARRWQAIVEPAADAEIAFGPLWRATAIGMMANNIAPARAGELARAYVLSREVPSIPFSAAFASLAVDRLFDALVLVLLLVAAMFSPGFPTGRRVAGQPVERFAVVGLVGAAALSALLYAVVFFPKALVGIWLRGSRRVAPRFAEPGAATLRAFASGLAVLRRPSRFAAVLTWSIIHWVWNAGGMWLAFHAVGIDAPFSAALFLQTVICIGVAAPSAPGFFGVFEFFAKAGLAVYGVAATLAVTWAVGYHLLSFVPIVVIGLSYSARLGVRLAALDASTAAPTS